MPWHVVNRAIARSLERLTTAVDLMDDSGSPLGQFFPCADKWRSCGLHTITVDPVTAGVLRNEYLTVELRDESGRLLGTFTPIFDPEKWEFVTPEISDEELARRELSNEWYTTEEVIAYLKSL